MSTAEQETAAAAANADADDDEAELFGEDEDDEATGTGAPAPAPSPAAAPAPTDPKAEEAPPVSSPFSIPKKESAEGTGTGMTTTTTTTTANASTATTPNLASPPKHPSDGNDDASPGRKLSNGGDGGGGGGDRDGPQLPDELVVPVSAKEIIAGDKSNRLKTLLLKLPIDQMSAALEEYDEAIQQKKPIRNHIGYLTGVLRRYLSIQERTTRPGDGGGAMGEMTAAVKDLIQTKLFETGFCTEIDLDEKIISKLKQLPEREAMAAIEEISRCDRSSIRNFSSYFMGILHRYMRGERDGALGGGGGGNGGLVHGRRPPHHHDGHHRGGPPPHRGGLDRYGGGRDDRDRHYGRGGYDGRGRDRPPYDRRGGGRRYERDRSPDFDRRRDDHHRDRGRERDRYDDRSGRDRSPDDHFGGGRSRRRYSSRSRSRSRSPGDSRSPYGRERKYSRDEGSNGSRRESRWGTNSGGGAPPGASPIAQPGLSQYGPSGGSTSWGAAPPQPPPQRQQPIGTRVFAPAPAPAPVAPPPSASYYGQQAPVGLAAQPAAGAYSTAAPYGQIPGVPPPAPAAATGILGLDLANLASQAQQALSAIHALPGPPVAALPAALPMQAQQPHQHHQQQQQAEVVTESDLPLMVQYSLTNLKTTGHIDTTGLDPGVCRMLKNVPENVALASLEKFQSCDTSLMRNKNSYLAGIIKRKRDEAGLGVY